MLTIELEDQEVYTTGTKVKIVKGTHKGKKGEIGETSRSGYRYAGKVQVIAGQQQKPYWVDPDYLELLDVQETPPEEDLEPQLTDADPEWTLDAVDTAVDALATVEQSEETETTETPEATAIPEVTLIIEHWRCRESLYTFYEKPHIVDRYIECHTLPIAEQLDLALRRIELCESVLVEYEQKLEQQPDALNYQAAIRKFSWEIEQERHLMGLLRDVDKTCGKIWIDPGTVILNAGTQSRTDNDTATIEKYSNKMQEAGVWDWEGDRYDLPVVFQSVSGSRYPGDAHHRLFAAIGSKAVAIKVDLRPGELVDAQLFSAEGEANEGHGLPFSPRDQRRRIELFLEAREQLPEVDGRRAWSSRKISEHLRLGKNSYWTVNQIIKEREMLVRISQFKEGDRVKTNQGVVGTVEKLDKKQGVLVTTDESLSAWVHPDDLTHSATSAPALAELVRNTQDEWDESDWGEGDRFVVSPSHPKLSSNVRKRVEAREIFVIEEVTATHVTSTEGIIFAFEYISPPPLPDEIDEAPPTSVKAETNGKGSSLGLKTTGDQTLPDVKRNEAPAAVDDRPGVTPPTIEINTNDICVALISNVPYLTDEQIHAVQSAIASRLNLALYDWPDEELKRIIKDAKSELNKRHNPKYSNGDSQNIAEQENE